MWRSVIGPWSARVRDSLPTRKSPENRSCSVSRRGLTPKPAVRSALNFALQAGNVTAVVNDLPVTAWLIKDPAKGLVIVTKIPTGEQYGYAVSKENPDLLKALNDALAKVKASGDYQKISDKWFPNM